jgi:hypothetical protein
VLTSQPVDCPYAKLIWNGNSEILVSLNLFKLKTRSQAIGLKLTAMVKNKGNSTNSKSKTSSLAKQLLEKADQM